MLTKIKRQLYHLTSDIIIREQTEMNKNENIISTVVDCAHEGHSQLKELSLKVLLDGSAISLFHNFFCQQVLLSSILLNLKHFYLTVTNQSQRSSGQGFSTSMVYWENGRNNINVTQRQKLIDKILHDLHANLSVRSKHGQAVQFNLESFGCEIGIDAAERCDEIVYWERICLFMLNKYGWLIKSLHLKTYTHNHEYSSHLSNVNAYVMDNWQFINNSGSVRGNNNHSCDYNYKNKNQSENKRDNVNVSLSYLPSKLQELCITDYKHNLYKNLIKSILDKENNISKFSLLEINKSKFEQVLCLLCDDDCQELIIESINNQRLSEIILNSMHTKIFNNYNKSRDLKLFTNFLNALADGIASIHDSKATNKRFVVKTSLTGDAVFKSSNFWFGSSLDRCQKTDQEGEIVRKQSDIMSQFVIDCFTFMSKMIEKIDQVLFIIEFNPILIQVSNDVAAVVDSIKSTFNCQAHLNKSKFISIIDLNISTFFGFKNSRIPDTFRMMFKNNGEFDNCKSCKRLYCCPNCDKDLQYK